MFLFFKMLLKVFERYTPSMMLLCVKEGPLPVRALSLSEKVSGNITPGRSNVLWGQLSLGHTAAGKGLCPSPINKSQNDRTQTNGTWNNQCPRRHGPTFCITTRAVRFCFFFPFNSDQWKDVLSNGKWKVWLRHLVLISGAKKDPCVRPVKTANWSDSVSPFPKRKQRCDWLHSLTFTECVQPVFHCHNSSMAESFLSVLQWNILTKCVRAAQHLRLQFVTRSTGSAEEPIA